MIKYGLLFLVGAYGAELLVAATSQGCACPKIYSPVCGTDGSTYTNACLLNCYSKMKPGLQVSHYGECKVTVPCVCTREYHPFCGTDGITYANECWLNCERKKNPLLQVAREGPCVQCACPYNYNPLCGSDGRTYSNQCEFDCQASQSSVPLKLLYAGECKHRKLDSAVRSLRGGEEGLKCRGCPFIYTPVCGTDGQTYSNHCMLECARITSNNPALKIKYNGQCRNCLICPLNYSPACGTDGKTYGNDCELDCTPGVTLAHRGPC